jgi:hypothetical protein
MLPLAEAAQVLGIAYDTARKRLHSGSLTGERRGGRWYVHVPNSATVADVEPETIPDVKPDQTEPIPDARDRLIAALEDDVEFLRRQVEESERRHAVEIERRDVLLREALGRIPQLPIGDSGGTHSDHPTASPDGQGATQSPDTTLDTSRSGVRRWWHRVLGVSS